MRLLLLATAFAAALTAVPDPGAAQTSRRDREREQERQGRPSSEEAAEARRERQRREWGAEQARLPGQRNAGPCPFVKVLYDAARYVEFAEAREAAGEVTWTGEIQGLQADCRYRDDDPIVVSVDVLMSFGKGPKAQGDSKTYNWWVAVTERNKTVLAKEYFATRAQFRDGQDRTAVNERLGGITIPRASQTVSGNNFEILIGFDVTPQMAEFNRDGKRFRLDAGQTAAR